MRDFDPSTSFGRLLRAAFAVLVIVAALGAAAPVMAQSRVPVMVGGHADLRPCIGIGRVADQAKLRDTFLAVRTGPAVRHTQLDRLQPGKEVNLCDFTADGQWIGVVYSVFGIKCGLELPAPRRQAYAGSCRSGWVNARFVIVGSR